MATNVRFNSEIESSEVVYLNQSIRYWWSSDKEGKNVIKKAQIYEVIYFHIILDSRDSTAQFHLFSKTETDLNIKKVVSFNKNKGTIELDLTFLLERNGEKNNIILEKWKKNIHNQDLKLYWKITNSKYTNLKLDSATINMFVDVHMINILDNHYRYTCNGGWIDKHHFSTTTTRSRIDIGATNLWKQLLYETGVNTADKKGFQVTYTQDMGKLFHLPFGVEYLHLMGVTRKYMVKKGLSIEIKKRIAMSIFQQVTYEFEEYQSSLTFELTGQQSAIESSFEPSDMVSNLLGLYSVLEKESPEDILKNLKELGTRSSLEVYNQYIGTFSEEKYKNKKFTPRFFDNTACTHIPKCVPKFPDKYQKIKPYPENDGVFREWIDLFDIYEGIPPMYGPKF